MQGGLAAIRQAGPDQSASQLQRVHHWQAARRPQKARLSALHATMIGTPLLAPSQEEGSCRKQARPLQATRVGLMAQQRHRVGQRLAMRMGEALARLPEQRRFRKQGEAGRSSARAVATH